MIQVTIVIDLDDENLASLGEAEKYISELLTDSFEYAEPVTSWNINKLEAIE